MKQADQKAEAGLSKLKKKRELQIGAHRVKIDRKIAEGGYADIYRVTDCNAGNLKNSAFFSKMAEVPYALKRMFIEAESLDCVDSCIHKAYNSELQLLKTIQGENIIKLIDHQENRKQNGFEVYLLLEFCPNGTLFDVIEEKCKRGLAGITDEA